MQDNLSKKLQGFRREIRREQIQAFKKSKRKELIEDGSRFVQMQQTYWGVLRHHELATLKQMSYEVLQCHMQMLYQVVSSESSCIFVDAFEKIMVILVDFYEEALNSWMEEARQYLFNVSIDQAVDSTDVYALTKVFSFIPTNTFLKIIGSIYHDINPQRNMLYLRKVVVMLKNLLRFSFLDQGHIKQLLQYLEPGLDLKLNKTINKDFILTVLMNISYSEEEQVIQLFKQEDILGRILDRVQDYGIQLRQFQTLSGLYSNCIEYLCGTIHSFPVEHQAQSDFQQEQVGSYFVYLPIFEALTGLNNQAINRNLVNVACCLLKTLSQCDLDCKSVILYTAQVLIRNIITMKNYLDSSEQLFILFAIQFEFENNPCPVWLADLLNVILTNYVMAYYGDESVSRKTKNKFANVEKGRILRNIKDILMACQTLLKKAGENFLQFQQMLVRSIFEFWCKEELIMGSEDLIIFLQIAIENSQELSNLIIFDKYQDQFTDFIDGSYERLQEIQAVLKLIDSTCSRLEQAKVSKTRAYLGEFSRKWENILTRIEGYCQDRSISQGQCSLMAIRLYDRVQKMLKDLLHQ